MMSDVRRLPLSERQRYFTYEASSGTVAIGAALALRLDWTSRLPEDWKARRWMLHSVAVFNTGSTSGHATNISALAAYVNGSKNLFSGAGIIGWMPLDVWCPIPAGWNGAIWVGGINSSNAVQTIRIIGSVIELHKGETS